MVKKNPKTNKAMKELIFSLALLVCSFKAFSQTIVARWDCDNTVSPIYVDPLFLSNATDITPSSSGYPSNFGYSTICSIPATDKFLWWSNWAILPETYDPVRFIELSITATSDMSLEWLELNTNRSSSGPTDWQVRWSLNGYLTYLYSNNTTSVNCASHAINLNSSVLLSGQTATFRFFAGGGTTTTGRWFVDKITIKANEMTTLPIEIVSFTGRSFGGGVELNWQTATERNNDYFTVFRSMNGEEWSEVGRVVGAGDSQAIVSYTLRDAFAPQGTILYRLRQTDFDGGYKEPWFVSVVHELPRAQTYTVGSTIEFHGRRFVVFDASGRVLVRDALVYTFSSVGTFVCVTEDGEKVKMLAY